MFFKIDTLKKKRRLAIIPKEIKLYVAQNINYQLWTKMD